MEYFDPASTTTAAVFACSPRAGGNTDYAAQRLAHGIHEAGGKARVITLRQYPVAPCLGCGRCEYDPNRHCFQARHDQSSTLFQTLLSAPVVVFASPIYFYHLPSGFKAFIDRGQCYYSRREQGDPELAALPRRHAFACLIAGRKEGKQTFDGALLTLRYFMQPFNRALDEPLLLRGVDALDDLRRSPELDEQLVAYGRRAWSKACDTVAPTA